MATPHEQLLVGMNDGEICGRHYKTRQPLCLRWRNGCFTEGGPVPSNPPPNLWLAPALVDLQVNGYAGVDFQRDGLSSSDLLRATRQLRRDGCTRILLTLITDEWPKLMSRLKRLRELREGSVELQQAIAGWHIEGPFLSSEPGFHGAHNPKVMLDPTPSHIRELRSLTAGDPLFLTVAPERPGVLDAICLAASLGIKVSLGHTNASAESLREAVKAGASAFTHLGNACPKELDRHDNILWRVFDLPGLTVGLIADGIHVSPALFRTIHKVVPVESIYYTTDAMSAAGAPPGRYTIGTLELEVGADQIVRQPGRTNFAGSALRPIDGIFRAARMLGRPWQDVWDAFSIRPAELMGIPSGFEPGQPADCCILRIGESELLTELDVICNGQLRDEDAGIPL